MRKHWFTAISILAGSLLVLSSTLGPIFGDWEGSAISNAVVIALLLSAGVALLAGLWWLRESRFSDSICLTFVGVGMVIFGVFFFWMLLVPTVLALIVLWFGIVKRDLVTELRPAPGT
jgi:hypothetical protein